MSRNLLQMSFVFILVSLTQSGNILEVSSPKDDSNRLEIVFYNLENLFDHYNDAEASDDEFTPDGLRHWTKSRFTSKLNKLSSAILAANHWEYPDIIAVAEIENESVIKQLTNSSLLKGNKYSYVHKESSDHRGIDVGILYDSTRIELLDVNFYVNRIDDKVSSRDLLYAQLNFNGGSLHLFVCHWPSRYSGVVSTNKNRLKTSDLLCEKIEEFNSRYLDPNIVVMGDFNDEPNDESVLSMSDVDLINLMSDVDAKGSLKFRGQWFMFDQFLVSSNIKKSCSAEVCELPFLFEKDEKYLGLKPFRTFNGYRYLGGYSDHLPIRLVLEIIK